MGWFFFVIAALVGLTAWVLVAAGKSSDARRPGAAPMPQALVPASANLRPLEAANDNHTQEDG